jgi:hypothetical protein
MKGKSLHVREPLLVIGGVCLVVVFALVFVGLIWLLKELKITADDAAVGKALIAALLAVAPGVLGLVVARGRVTPLDPKTQLVVNSDVVPSAGERVDVPSSTPARTRSRTPRRDGHKVS